MQPKKLTSDIEITEFLIQEIQNPTLKNIYHPNPVYNNYAGICQALTIMFFADLITILQKDNFIHNYIEPKVEKDEYLFLPYHIPLRIEFLQNLLNQLKNTNHEKTN